MSQGYDVANTRGMVCQLDPNSISISTSKNDTSVSMVLNDGSTTRSESHSTKPALSIPDPINSPIERASSNGTICETREIDPGTQAQAHTVAFAQGDAGQCSQFLMSVGELDELDDDNDESAVHALVRGDDGPTLMPDGWLCMKERKAVIMAAISVMDSFTETSSARYGNDQGQSVTSQA